MNSRCESKPTLGIGLNRDFPGISSYCPMTVARSAVEDDDGLDREIAWRPYNSVLIETNVTELDNWTKCLVGI